MHKKLTITVDEEIYEGLHRVIGRGAISQFIAELVRPHVIRADLDAAYGAMAADEARETAALEWIDALAEPEWDAVDGAAARARSSPDG